MAGDGSLSCRSFLKESVSVLAVIDITKLCSDQEVSTRYLNCTKYLTAHYKVCMTYRDTPPAA